MVVVINISALNDTTFLAKRLVMWLAWKLGAWWKKKMVRLFWSALVSEAMGGKICLIKVSVY